MKLSALTILLVGALAGCGQEELGQDQQGIVHLRYVFVHGSWQGGWVWDSVAQHLRDEGETVTVVNLPAHDTDPMVAANATLDSYVERVSLAVNNGGSLPVHLIGHSLGGVVITQFAERDPSKVQDLVYLAGLLPGNGQSALDLAGADTGSQLVPQVITNLTLFTAALPLAQIGPTLCADCTSTQLGLLQSHYRDEPLLPLLAPVTLTAANFGSVTKKYLFTVNDLTLTYTAQQAMAATVTMAKTATINSSHQPQLSHASQLTDIIKDLVK